MGYGFFLRLLITRRKRFFAVLIIGIIIDNGAARARSEDRGTVEEEPRPAHQDCPKPIAEQLPDGRVAITPIAKFAIDDFIGCLPASTSAHSLEEMTQAAKIAVRKNFVVGEDE